MIRDAPCSALDIVSPETLSVLMLMILLLVEELPLTSKLARVGVCSSGAKPASSEACNSFVFAANSGAMGCVTAKAGSTPAVVRDELACVLAGSSRAFRLATSNAAIQSVNSCCVSACRITFVSFVFTSKQKRRSSKKAGRTEHSRTPVFSLSSTPPPLRGFGSSQPKMPALTKNHLLTHIVRVGLCDVRVR